jgi:hypothetical protein
LQPADESQAFQKLTSRLERLHFPDLQLSNASNVVVMMDQVEPILKIGKTGRSNFPFSFLSAYHYPKYALLSRIKMII